MPKQAYSKIASPGILLITVALLLLICGVVTGPQAQAQTLHVIHNFTGGIDGGRPWAGVTLDGHGHLYGTTFVGGSNAGSCEFGAGCGVVFRMTQTGNAWIFAPLYAFAGGSDGAQPWAGVTIGPNGALYGTTSSHATVYELRPPLTVCKAISCPWTETVIHRFAGGADGSDPGYGSVAFDSTGNLYDTTVGGGVAGQGTVYELSPVNGGWQETVLWSFTGTGDGGQPYDGLLVTPGGLYGTTNIGGLSNYGVAFQLTGGVDNVLQNFSVLGPDGAGPIAGLISDRSGNLYGATGGGGTGNGGTVFELSPSHGGWNYTVLHSFSGMDGAGPYGTLTMDAGGSLYGTTFEGGAHNDGAVFRLSPSNNGWIFTDLHDFDLQTDGATPYGGVAIDSAGNLYGTTYNGGPHGVGVVWEITP